MILNYLIAFYKSNKFTILTRVNKRQTVFMKKIQTFHDAYNFADQIVQGEIEHFQLEPGAFYGELTQIISQNVIVGVHNMNIPILQIGRSIKGYITFLIPRIEQNISWREFNINEKRIGILKGGGNHFALTPSGFMGLPISLSNDYLTELLRKYGNKERIYKLIHQSEVIDLNAEDAFKIQQKLIALNKADKIDFDLMINELPSLLLKSILNVADQLPKKYSTSKQILLNRILIYIQENLNRRVNTLELSKVFKISERKLRYIFRESIGCSPMRYIKIIRLNKTRKDILYAKENIDINLVANKWGFNHSGQFAADYQMLFGELPSETLKKSSNP